ncbi:TPA: flagellar hook-associated protein FlgK [Clostridioides difficile]|nr:flagellar hook-associated protein FlgK [Clostridioides difficile]
MAGLFSILNTANSGMNAHQKSIQTISHNISNLDTDGYSRQRTEFATNSPMYMPSLSNSIGRGQLGTGVHVTDVTRARNSFYDYQFRAEAHKYGNTVSKYDYYNTIETILNEPSDYGISAGIDDFFKGWESLSKDINSDSKKSLVVENASNLATLISESYKKLDKLKGDIDSNIDTEIKQINDMLKSLEDLNKSIDIISGSGSTPNDLLDERDRILDNLSFKLDLENSDVKNMLSDGKLELNELKNADGTWKTGISGTLQGLFGMHSKIDTYKSDLKDVSDGLAKQINDVYNASAGITVRDFFITSNVAGEDIIKVNPAIKSNSNELKLTTEEASKIAKLKDEKIDIGIAGGKVSTISDHYKAFAESVGLDSQKVNQDEVNQRKIINNVDNSRMSVSGASLDEEMTELMKVQRSYQASAKVMSTAVQLLDVVINGII